MFIYIYIYMLLVTTTLLNVSVEATQIGYSLINDCLLDYSSESLAAVNSRSGK